MNWTLTECILWLNEEPQIMWLINFYRWYQTISNHFVFAICFSLETIFMKPVQSTWCYSYLSPSLAACSLHICTQSGLYVFINFLSCILIFICANVMHIQLNQKGFEKIVVTTKKIHQIYRINLTIKVLRHSLRSQFLIGWFHLYWCIVVFSNLFYLAPKWIMERKY